MGFKGTFSGRSAIVTGAANGIGRSITRSLIGKGASVAGLDVDADGLSDLQTEITSSKLLVLETDVSLDSQVETSIKRAIKSFGGVDFLVNNAGIYSEIPFLELSLEQWKQVIQVNLTSMFLCCKYILPTMKDQGRGRIVNVSSQAAFDGSSKAAHYAASKSGVIGLSHSLAREFGPYGITVNCIAPGIIETQMNPESRLVSREEEWLKKLPLKRFGQPSDIASVVIFLLSGDASYITGQTILVNGGMRMMP